MTDVPTSGTNGPTPPEQPSSGQDRTPPTPPAEQAPPPADEPTPSPADAPYTPPPASSPPAATPPGSTPAPATGWPASAGMTASEQRNWATGAHLSAIALAFFGGLAVIGPLVVYLIKKDEDRYVAEHAKEALNFQLTWLIGGFVGTIVGVVVALVTVGLALIVLIPLAIGLFVAWVVFTVKAAMAASRGEYYRYPMTVRMVS